MMLRTVAILVLALFASSQAFAGHRHHHHYHRHADPIAFKAAVSGHPQAHVASQHHARHRDHAGAAAAQGWGLWLGGGQVPFQAQEAPQEAPIKAALHLGNGRPHAWCGWYMRQVMGVVDPTYNLAREWAHWGRPAGGPAPGVVGVMWHHVFLVVSVVGPGRVIATSGNDGYAVRTRERSTAGVIAWRQR